MEIVEGRYYKTRNGDKVGPMRFRDWSADTPWESDGDADRIWKEDGTRGYYEPSHDLIAEWTDGPVRTVTRTVTETAIQPGTYARITVNDEGKAGMVGIWLNDGHYFSPSDLRAAAAVLLELAGALDSE